MAKYFKATIEVLVEVEDEPSACDAISEALRPLLREFEPGSEIIDWRYEANNLMPVEHDGKGFEYADAEAA